MALERVFMKPDGEWRRAILWYRLGKLCRVGRSLQRTGKWLIGRVRAYAGTKFLFAY
jgi:hypothetical protein